MITLLGIGIGFIFVLSVSVIQYLSRIRVAYKCPECGQVFRPHWYQFGVLVNWGECHPLRCPSCKNDVMCKRHEP